MTENGENFEDICNPHFLPADHHLLQPMQRDMTKQLETELETLLLDLNQKNNILKRLERETENKGVQLYELQQQLAKLQEKVKQENEDSARICKEREDNEIRLREMEKKHLRSKKEVKGMKKRLWKTMEELSKQNATLREIEQHQKVLTSEIKITRRITYKIEEDIEMIGNLDYWLSNIYIGWTCLSVMVNSRETKEGTGHVDSEHEGRAQNLVQGNQGTESRSARTGRGTFFGQRSPQEYAR